MKEIRNSKGHGVADAEDPLRLLLLHPVVSFQATRDGLEPGHFRIERLFPIRVNCRLAARMASWNWVRLSRG